MVDMENRWFLVGETTKCLMDSSDTCCLRIEKYAMLACGVDALEEQEMRGRRVGKD